MFYSENDRYSRSFFSDRHYTSESLCCLLLVYILYIPLSNIYMGYLVYIRVETLVRETATSLWWNLCPHKTFSHTDVIVSLVENVYPQYPINQVQIKNKKTHTHTNMSSWPHTHTEDCLFCWPASFCVFFIELEVARSSETEASHHTNTQTKH